MSTSDSSAMIRNLGIAALLLAVPLFAQCDPPSPVTSFNQNLNNTVPVARAGADGEAALGVTLTLDGSSSYDPDGDEITYHWELDEAPEGSALLEAADPFAVNDTRNAGVTAVVPDMVGVYIFALTVEDPFEAFSERDYVIYNVSSTLQLPVADAGSNTTALEGAEVCLDGSDSWDPGGRELSYSWTMVATPQNSAVTSADLSAPDAVDPCFTPDAAGTFTVALTVSTDVAVSEPDFVFVAVGSTNQGPEAEAGVLNAFSCDFVQLDGTASTDPEGDTLNYSWDLLLVPIGSELPLGTAAFDDASAAQPAFYADVEGNYTVQLVVDDGESYSTPVFVELDLTQKTENQPPTVVTSPDAYFYSPGPTCQTDAYGNCTNCPTCTGRFLDMNAFGTSDPDGDPVTVTWAIQSGPAAAAVSPTEGMESTLDVPGPPGNCAGTTASLTVQVQVTATDCSGDTGVGYITVLHECN